MFLKIKNWLIKFKNWIIFSVLGVGVVLAAGQALPDNIPEHLKLKCDKADIIFSREIGDNVSYLYNSKEEVKQAKHNGLDEDISKRTKNAQFFPKTNLTTTAKIYAGEPFYKKDNKWFQTETATTTKKEFTKQTKISLLDKFFRVEVLADSANYFSGAGDGRVGTNTNVGWDTAHDALTAPSEDYDNTIDTVQSYIYYGYYRIYRLFFPIDTSGLPDNAVISAASFKIYSTGGTYCNNQDGNNWVGLVQTSQVSTASLVEDDFDQCGDINNPTEGSDTRLDIPLSIGVKTFVLNATGRGWISKTGYTKLGLREGHDVVDDPVDDECRGEVKMSEYADTTYDPYIEITYTSGGKEDTCTYSSGDWNVLESDNCYITSDVYVDGKFNLIGGATGQFGCAPGIKVSAENFNFGTASTTFDMKCFAHH